MLANPTKLPACISILTWILWDSQKMFQIAISCSVLLCLAPRIKTSSVYACFRILFPRYEKNKDAWHVCETEEFKKYCQLCMDMKIVRSVGHIFPVYISNISFGLVYCASPVKLKLITHFLGEKFFLHGGSKCPELVNHPQIQ